MDDSAGLPNENKPLPPAGGAAAGVVVPEAGALPNRPPGAGAGVAGLAPNNPVVAAGAAGAVVAGAEALLDSAGLAPNENPPAAGAAG